VREGSLDSGWRLAAGGLFSVLVDLFLGSCSPAVRASVELRRGEAVGSWALRWMIRCFFLTACRREALSHGCRSPTEVTSWSSSIAVLSKASVRWVSANFGGAAVSFFLRPWLQR